MFIVGVNANNCQISDSLKVEFSHSGQNHIKIPPELLHSLGNSMYTTNNKSLASHIRAVEKERVVGRKF